VNRPTDQLLSLWSVGESWSIALFAHTYMYVYICIYIYMNIYVCTCVHVYIHICIFIFDASVMIRMKKFISVPDVCIENIRISIYICVYICIYIYIYVYMYVHICIYIYICMYIQMIRNTQIWLICSCVRKCKITLELQ
jgi:hypothetical protein